MEFDGAVHHVMERGNERREIFRSDQNRAMFLEALAGMEEQLAKKPGL